MSDAAPLPGDALLPRVQAMLGEHLGIEPRSADYQSRLVDDLGCDSLDCIEVTMAAESLFGVLIEDAEAEALVTVADLLRLLDAKGVAP